MTAAVGSSRALATLTLMNRRIPIGQGTGQQKGAAEEAEGVRLRRDGDEGPQGRLVGDPDRLSCSTLICALRLTPSASRR